jgi:hypothetical protein
VLRNQTFKSHQAGVPESIRPDLALFEFGEKNSIDATLEQPRQVGLAKMRWQWPEVFAFEGQHIESVKLHLIIVLAAVQPIVIGRPSTPSIVTRTLTINIARPHPSCRP